VARHPFYVDDESPAVGDWAQTFLSLPGLLRSLGAARLATTASRRSVGCRVCPIRRSSTSNLHLSMLCR
jgi:hypothetical protein